MALNRIRLSHFRNHASSELVGSEKFNLLIGENGAGKTNVLEAISLFAPGRGLRRAALVDMAFVNKAGVDTAGHHGDNRGDGRGDGSFAISADLHMADQEPVQIGTGTHPARPSRRIVQINSAETSATALGEWLSLFWLTPAMDRLFMESPSGRRRFMDRLVLALDPHHARNAARYDKALREKNRLLSEVTEPDRRWFDALNAQMAEAGALIATARKRLIDRLQLAIAQQPASPFARPYLIYQSDTSLQTEALYQAISANHRLDRAARRSLIGPHRDDLLVSLPTGTGINQPAIGCSTGEQKAMLIAITLAHAGLTGAEATPRILLLDEVAAHLDAIRRAALFEQLADSPAQIWMTGTETAPFSAITQNLAHWHIAAGRVL